MSVDQFKLGDRVTHSTMGLGTIVKTANRSIHVEFDKHAGRRAPHGIYNDQWFRICGAKGVTITRLGGTTPMTNQIKSGGELLPCPLCGADAELRDMRTGWMVICKSCGCSVNGEFRYDIDHQGSDEAGRALSDSIDWAAVKQTAITAWSTRRTPAKAGEDGDREAQSIWRCAVGDMCAAVDILKNRWVNSRRKAEREAGAELAKVADAIWSIRSPAPSTYGEASDAGKRLIGLVKSNLSSIEEPRGE